ncbi:MAG: M20/M25/M40 family metallo-hydrolase [Candidatus Hodarchaeota archaeon]
MSPEPLWQKVFEEVSQDTYHQYVQTLSESIGSRSYSSEGNDDAVEWIASTMQSISGGIANVEIWGDYQSVVGIIEGYDSSLSDIIVIGGHMDTVPGSPGADDNASGTALVLEALRTMSRFRFPRDIYFCTFNAEETGLFGAQEVAGLLAANDIPVQMMFNADMILWDPVGIGQREYIYYGSDAELRAAEFVQNMSLSYGEGVFLVASGGGGGSDHIAFHQQGYNAVFTIETNFNPHWHLATDNIFHPECNFTLATETTASIAAAAAKLAFEDISPTLDFDNDSLPDLSELEIGTDPTNPDTDRDGLLDGEEVNTYHTDPLKLDTDDDALSDGMEITDYQTDPLDADSDDDNIDDGDEIIAWGTNPLVADTDHDGLDDGEEIMIHNTNPTKNDSDADGLPDGQEIQLGTDPTMRDSDGDLILDGEEIEKGWDPLDSESPGETKDTSKSSKGFMLPILLLGIFAAIYLAARKKES